MISYLALYIIYMKEYFNKIIIDNDTEVLSSTSTSPSTSPGIENFK